MGCDIHGIVEIRENGTWKRFSDLPYDGRSYKLFSRLADVRNYDKIEHMELKGLPDDSECSYEDIEDPDHHSFNHFTLEELLDFANKHKTIRVSGKISAKQKKELDKGILPKWYYRDTNIKGFVFAEWVDEDNNAFDFYQEIRDTVDYKTHDEDIRVIVWFDN